MALIDDHGRTDTHEQRVVFSTGSYMYHLRVYVYQAQNLASMDKDSFSGPFLHDFNYCKRLVCNLK